MKKYIQKHSKLLAIFGILLCAFLIVALSVQFVSTIAYAQSKKQYQEPSVRPDIREDAVWDSDLGMYISGDYIKNTEGKYELNPDSFVCDTAESPEEKWWLLHADSKNEIDLAIKYSVELASKEAPTIYSSISPRSSEAILTAMSALSPSCYPEVWERICIEPAYRAQKIVALEQFLGVFFDDLGLYDHLAQRKWFDSFNALRQEISDQSFEQISKADYAQYGNLLLPMLAQKAMDNTLHESELKVLGEMIENMNKQFHPSLENASITSTKAASEWFDAHLSTIEAISEIIQSNYTWVE